MTIQNKDSAERSPLASFLSSWTLQRKWTVTEKRGKTAGVSVAHQKPSIPSRPVHSLFMGLDTILPFENSAELSRAKAEKGLPAYKWERVMSWGNFLAWCYEYSRHSINIFQRMKSSIWGILSREQKLISTLMYMHFLPISRHFPFDSCASPCLKWQLDWTLSDDVIPLSPLVASICSHVLDTYS